MPTNNHSDNLFDAQAPLNDEQLWDLLSLYVDGEADPAQAAIVEQMLSSDPAYRRDFDFLMQTSKTMHRVEEVAPPAGLRDAIYAATVRRPTLAGRLHAAWKRTSSPGFIRFATIGGACAVAILGAVIVRPHLNSVHPDGPGAATVATAPRPHTAIAMNPTPADPHVQDFGPNTPAPKLKPSPRSPIHQEFVSAAPSIKPSVGPDLHKAAAKSGLQVAVATPTPQHHHLPKSSAFSPENGVTVAVGYPYNKKMDEDTAHRQMKTIVASTGNDFGPQVAPNDDVSTSMPSEGETQVAAAQKPADDLTTKPSPTADLPKKTVHIAALPPGAVQNISQAVIRRNINAQYDGYDHTIADNIQRHELLVPVIKGSF